MGIGIIPFNHSNWHLYFSECPKYMKGQLADKE